MITNRANHGAATATTLTANRASLALGDPVQLTATVSAASGNLISAGQVTFTAGKTTLGTAELRQNGTSATASLLTGPAVPGSHNPGRNLSYHDDVLGFARISGAAAVRCLVACAADLDDGAIVSLDWSGQFRARVLPLS